MFTLGLTYASPGGLLSEELADPTYTVMMLFGVAQISSDVLLLPS